MSTYLSLIWRRRGWALIRGWELINFFGLWDGRLFEVGANSRSGAYSNKYGRSNGENLLKYQLHSSCVIMSLILMTTVFYKAVIFQEEI